MRVKELGIRFLTSRVFPTVTWCVANFAHFVRRALKGWKRQLSAWKAFEICRNFVKRLGTYFFQKMIGNAFRLILSLETGNSLRCILAFTFIPSRATRAVKEMGRGFPLQKYTFCGASSEAKGEWGNVDNGKAVAKMSCHKCAGDRWCRGDDRSRKEG